MLSFYIKAEADNPKKFKAVLTKVLTWIFFLFPGWIFWTAQLKFDIWSELTHEGFGTNVPSLYLQVCIINMPVYIQPLSVMKDMSYLKSTSNCF